MSDYRVHGWVVAVVAYAEAALSINGTYTGFTVGTYHHIIQFVSVEGRYEQAATGN
jgi:hypothetical protein